MQIRNSEGQLVAYLEPTEVKFGNPDVINHYLDTKLKSIITKGGQKLEKIQFEEKGTFIKSHVMSEYHLVDSTGKTGPLVLTVRNDGYQVQLGDSYDVWWTMLVPVG